MDSFITKSGSKRSKPRLSKLEVEGKTTNATLFQVENLLTGLVTLVPGGVISRFLNENYTVTEFGPNQSGSASPSNALVNAEVEADGIVADAEAKAADILAKAADAEKAAEAKLKEAEAKAKAAEKALAEAEKKAKAAEATAQK